MKKILIIVLSEISTGELTIGYEFGSRLNKDEFTVCFMIPQKFKSFLEDRREKCIILDVINGPDINYSLFDQYIREDRPDYIFLSDIYTTEYSKAWSGVSMKRIKHYGIPIIGLDEYEYLSTTCTPDYYGGVFERLPELLKECDFIVRDCPLNAPRKEEKDIFNFSIYEEKIRKISGRQKLVIREKFGIGDDQKIIFYASSSWENINFRRSPSLQGLMKWIPIMLQKYIEATQEKVTLVHIGPVPWRKEKKGKLNYVYYSNLLPSHFDELLLASDLLVTINSVSVTMSKAIFGNVPCILFQNKKHIDFNKLQNRLLQMPEWYKEMAEEVGEVFPFRAGFFGWYELLKNVMIDNDYTKTYEEVPIFKMDLAVERIREYLVDKEKIRELNYQQAKYVADLQKKVDTPNQIMQKISMLGSVL